MAQGIKTGGRQKGTPNKFTADIRQTLKNVLADELEQLPGIMAELPPEKRVDVLVKLAQYVLPKVVTVRHDTGEPEPPNWGERVAAGGW